MPTFGAPAQITCAHRPARRRGTQLQHGIFGQADAALGPVKFRRTPSQLCRDGESVFSPNGGSSSARNLRARSAYRSFAPVERALPRFQRGRRRLGQRPVVPEKLWGLGGHRLIVRTHLPRTAYRNSRWPDYQRHALQYAHAIVRQRDAAAAISRGVEVNS